MTGTGIANLVLLVICALLAWTVIFRAVPWMVKTGVLYALHTLRDRLYAAAGRAPEIRQTLIYRDVEFLLCGFIHICRDRGPDEVLSLASALHRRRHRATRTSWRRGVYDEELVTVFAGAKGHAALIELVDIAAQARPVILLRSVAESPLFLTASVIVVVVIGAFVWLVITIGKVFDPRPDPTDFITRDVETVAGLLQPVAA